MIEFGFIASWVLGALLVNKLDAALTGEPSTKFNAIMGLVIWPVIAVLLLTTKHHVNNGVQDYWDY